MARFRHILLTLASGSALYSGMAPALGLGDISLHSALNQPLEADIELIQANDLTADEIRVRLASSEDFERSGVDRFMFLNDLRFSPIMRNGKQLIRVVSSKPVREPYLNFIVELSRPGGNLLREYTLLIDPPGSAAYNAVASSNEQLQAAPTRRTTPAAVPAQPRPIPAANTGQRYQVRSGDSLWTIAGRLQAGGSTASRDALMADIHALNPQAFSGGDRNRLRANTELLLPDSAVASASQAPAAAVAVEQNASAPATPEPQKAPETPQLQATQRELDLQVASQTAENQQLQSLIGDLQTQLLQLQVQMAEKDEQLAAISAQLEQQRQAVAPVEQAAPVVDEAAPISEPAAAVPVEEAPVAQAPATPVSDSAPVSSNWSLWLGALALLLGLLAGFFLRGRRKDAVVVAEPSPQAAAPVVARPVVAAVAQAEPVAPVAAVASAPLMPRATTFSSDALEGANIYIAYGRFGEARNALRKAIEHEPARLDLRLRLLEVLGELGDASGFASEEQRARELGANPVQIEQIRARYSHVPPVAEPAEPLADAVLQLDEPAAPAAELVADDFQLNLDDLSLDADWDLVSPFKQDAPVRGKVITPPSFDPAFRSNLRELPEVEELSHHDSGHFDGEVLNEEFVDAFAEQPLKADLEHLAGNREHLVTLNMALAYIDQGDIGSACDILNELISEGDEHEKARARELLAQIA